MWTHIQQIREVDGRQDQASKPGGSRAETLTAKPRHPPPHSARRACAVQVSPLGQSSSRVEAPFAEHRDPRREPTEVSLISAR